MSQIILPLVLQGKTLTDLLPYRLVDIAIDGNPRDAKGEIFAIGDAEFLVPVERGYGADGHLSSFTSRLDLARKIINRPNGMREIKKLVFSETISPMEMRVLTQAVEEEHPAFPHYSTQIIRPQL